MYQASQFISHLDFPFIPGILNQRLRIAMRNDLW